LLTSRRGYIGSLRNVTSDVELGISKIVGCFRQRLRAPLTIVSSNSFYSWKCVSRSMQRCRHGNAFISICCICVGFLSPVEGPVVITHKTFCRWSFLFIVDECV
jgi:hypothetical protein